MDPITFGPRSSKFVGPKSPNSFRPVLVKLKFKVKVTVKIKVKVKVMVKVQVKVKVRRSECALPVLAWALTRVT